MKISARNRIPGTVKMIQKGPVSTEVVISIVGGNQMVAPITPHSAEKMNLREVAIVHSVMNAS
jgi:molybdopterin-binding protein